MSARTKVGRISQLLHQREQLVARLERISAVLAELGIRTTDRTSGVARKESLLVLTLLGEGVQTPAAIAERSGQSVHAVDQMLHLMVERGEAVRVGRGVYALAKRRP